MTDPAAVPEAQDGREAIAQKIEALPHFHRNGVMVSGQDMRALTAALVRASAAAREDERERLRGIIAPLINYGLDDFRMGRVSNTGLTTRIVDALAAPEGRASTPSP